MSGEKLSVSSGCKVTVEVEIRSLEGDLLSASEEDGPFTFTFGADQAMPGLERIIDGLHSGDAFQASLQVEEAFGQYDEDALEWIPLDAFGEEPVLDEDYEFEDEDGETILVRLVEIDGDEGLIDYNHPLAGMDLSIKGVVTSVESP